MKRWRAVLSEASQDPRFPWALLGAAMLCSLVYCLWAADGVYFTDDELYWLGSSPDTTFVRAFDPHSGHLVAVSRLLYKWIFETLGTGYLPFRLLSLGAIFLAVGLFFAWARKRVGDYAALAPCLVLLFFGSDARHLILGNGFTVVFAVACGLAALLALERRTRRYDLLACAALSLGVLTYTTALPFVIGAVVAILLGPDRRRRIWIPLVPILLYGGWRIWLKLSDAPVWRGETDPANLLLVPAWTFQSMAAILGALSGLGFNFSGTEVSAADATVGPPLAILMLIAVAWRFSRGRISPSFWVALAVAVAMFSSQALAWIPDVREPGDARYLFPGAFVLLLVVVEAARGVNFGRSALLGIWVLALVGVGANATLARDEGKGFALRADYVRAETTAAKLLHQSTTFVPGSSAVPGGQRYIEPAVDLLSRAEDSYGIGLSQEQLAGKEPFVRADVDRLLGEGIGIGLSPSIGTSHDPGCKTVVGTVEPTFSAGRAARAIVPAGGLSLFSRSGGEVTLRRFGDQFAVPAGELEPGTKMQLFLPRDPYPTAWQIQVKAPRVTFCPIPG